MKRVGLVITILLALVAFGVGFGGVAGYLEVTQPAIASSHALVKFVVAPGDTTASVAANLEKLGLVRNATIFRAWARYRHLDRGIEPGVYNLSPSMTIDSIIHRLQQGKPDEAEVTVPPSLRVTQYPAYFASMKNFDAQRFLQIAKTGTLPDGTPLWQKYWYVEKPQPNVAYALEGYLYPDTYFFNATDTEVNVVERMLNTLGEQLCPGPQSNPDLYIHDEAQCKAHAATVDAAGKVSIFAAMEQHYFTTDDTFALYQTLTIASITAREILHLSDAPGVAGVYYTRYAALIGKIPNAGGVANMGSDPAVEYARDTVTPPADGHWWRDLVGKGEDTAPNSPYNVYTNGGKLTPGPIAAPIWPEIAAAANPPATPYFYFLSDKCGNIHYAKTNDDFNVLVQKYLNNGQCSTAVNS